MRRLIVVGYDALAGDYVPVWLGAAGARLRVAAICTLGTDWAGLARQVEQGLNVEATLGRRQRGLRPFATEARSDAAPEGHD
jgi:hypothetical protein